MNISKGWTLTAMVAIGAVGCRGGGSVASTGKAHIKWKIVEVASGKVIGQGDKDIKPGDITSETTRSAEIGDLVLRKLPLSDHFRLGLGQSGSSAEGGFGFTVDKDDEPVFSWDWFTVNGRHATKLQESGELSLEAEGGRIVRTVFLTDVSMRAFPMSATVDPSNPKWRIEIANGSIIDWPR